MARNSSEQQNIPGGKAMTLPEFSAGGVSVDPVTDMTGVELEAFMNEPVTIYVHKTKEKGALDVITPSVNGKNQPIVRGVQTVVKRKYVEALIQSHSVEYEQQINANSPDQYQMVKKPTPSYPFDVIEDSRKGKAWKQRLETNLALQA